MKNVSIVLIHKDFHFRNPILALIEMKGRDTTNGGQIIGETIKGQVISDFLYVEILLICCPPSGI